MCSDAEGPPLHAQSFLLIFHSILSIGKVWFQLTHSKTAGFSEKEKTEEELLKTGRLKHPRIGDVPREEGHNQMPASRVVKGSCTEDSVFTTWLI